MKTILIVPGFLCDTFCSIEKISFELTDELSKKYNIIWLVPDINNKDNGFVNYDNKKNLKEPVFVTEAKKKNINLITANLSKYNLIKNLLILNKVFKENKIDAVLVQFGYERFILPICTKILGKKIIYYEHLNPSFHRKGKFFVWLKLLFYKIFINDFISISNFITSTLPEGKKIYEVHNSKELIEYERIDDASKQDLKQKLNLSKFDYVITMIAAFRKEKRHDLAFEIVKKIKDTSDKKIGFVFLGGNILYDKYKDLAKQSGLDEILILPGHVNNVNEYLMASDIHMMTCQAEPFGICILDAMNYRLPNISFKVPAITEIVEDSKDGYLVEFPDTDKFAEKIFALIENPELRTKMGDEGYNKLKEKYSVSAWREKMRAVFDQIMN